MNQKRVLIIASAEEAESIGINDAFVANIQERLGSEQKIEWHNYRDLRIEFGTNTIEVVIESTNEALRAFDFVYFKSFFRYSEHAAAVAAYLDKNDIPYVCSELRNHIALTKVSQFARLATSGAPIADTVLLHASRFRQRYTYLVEKLGTPFIFKSTDGSGGDENYLIHTEAELQAALDEYPTLHFVAQNFIENQSDLRVLIVGEEIKLVIERVRSGESHMNNTSQGGAAHIKPLEALPEGDRELCLKVARLMNREIAGVDLMYETGTGQPYILEVNASPQIGSGAFMEEKLDIYCEYFKNVVK